VPSAAQQSRNRHESQCGHDDRAGHAPLADGVDLRQLDVGQPDAEAEPDERQERRRQRARLFREREAGEDGDVAAEAEHGNGDAPELGPAGGLHALAAARAADADGLQVGVVDPGQVARDRDPDEREDGGRAPEGHEEPRIASSACA